MIADKVGAVVALAAAVAVSARTIGTEELMVASSRQPLSPRSPTSPFAVKDA
jgi:hypothetical protein